MAGQCNTDGCDREAVVDWGTCATCYSETVNEITADILNEDE